MNGIYERIAKWLLECPEMEGYVYFNVIPLEENTASVNSNSGSSTINKYIDGSTEVHLLFNINLVKSYDNGGTSDLNLDAIQSFNNIISFIEKKNLLKEYPDLGDNYIVNEICPTYKSPEVYVTPDNPNIARYEGQFYIEYLEKGEK